jgi:hypothetical protein
MTPFEIVAYLVLGYCVGSTIGGLGVTLWNWCACRMGRH